MLPSDLARQVKDLDADPARRRQMSEKGQKYVKTNFQWEDHVDRLLENFERVMANLRR